MRRLVVVCAFAAACGGKVDRNELSGQVRQLHAYAAEAHLLWVNDDVNDTPRAYARVQRSQLVDKIRDAVRDLHKAEVPPELDPALRDAQVLGQALESAARAGRGDLGDIEARLAVLDEVLRP